MLAVHANTHLTVSVLVSLRWLKPKPRYRQTTRYAHTAARDDSPWQLVERYRHNTCPCTFSNMLRQANQLPGLTEHRCSHDLIRCAIEITQTFTSTFRYLRKPTGLLAVTSDERNITPNSSVKHTCRVMSIYSCNFVASIPFKRLGQLDLWHLSGTDWRLRKSSCLVLDE